MGLIGKVTHYVPKLYNYTKRLVKASPYIIFEDAAQGGAKAAAAVTKTADMTVFQYLKNMIKAGGKGIEKSIETTKGAVGKNFFKASWKSIKEIPSVIGASVKAEAKAATGLGKIWAGTKGFFKGVGKKLPLIGNLMLVAFELPNIIKATKEKGIGQGVAEAAKAGARLTGASILSAVGTTVAGPIGGIAGFIIGDWLTSKIVGKSYTEKVEQEKQKDEEALERVQQMQQEGRLPQQATQVTQTPAFTGNPYNNAYQSNPFGYDNFSNPYADDMFMQGMRFNALG